MSATFNDAIDWLANMDGDAGTSGEHPTMCESLTADLFGTTTEHVQHCVTRARAYHDNGKPAPRMRAKVRT